ncbi:MAG: hypothetical protein IPL98_01780 [Saprospiraceae bacterium]|nr:hypothetical protein [Saprospiraceae bacterium]
MITIDNIIELKTNSKTERLSFATRYLVQINFTFDLTVLSDSFGGTSHFCVRREQIEKLCSDLTEMKDRLSGNTNLEDNDSDANLCFQIERYGQVYVFGQVGGSYEDNYVKFKFQTDQTCIEPLIEDFLKLLKYEEPTTLYETIDYILWNEWDPIGINDIAPREEYQSYTPTIYNLKNIGADKELIVKTLHKIETETMGLLGNIEHCKEIADKIIKLQDTKKNGI